MFTIEFCDKIVFTSISVHYRVLGAFFNNAHFHVRNTVSIHVKMGACWLGQIRLSDIIEMFTHSVFQLATCFTNILDIVTRFLDRAKF